MARIRTIKPEYWTDERVGECSPTARLLFIACWNFADDQGGLDRSAKQLKAQAFPYDVIDCEPLLQELIKVGLLIAYEVCGKNYLHISGFRKHQKIEKPAKPRIPVYEEKLKTPRVLPDSSPTTHRGVEVSSSEGNGKESKGREEYVRGAREAPRETEDAIFEHVSAIKARYPKAAREDWITAEQHLRRLVEEGATWQELEGGVERYRRHCAAENRRVMNPANFFGAVDKPWSQEWPLSKETEPIRTWRPKPEDCEPEDPRYASA